jgi:predicted RNase H-like HicB family nuclease
VPGCISTGKTLTEMRRMMREEVESHLQWLAADGDSMPVSKTGSVEFTEDDLSIKIMNKIS